MTKRAAAIVVCLLLCGCASMDVGGISRHVDMLTTAASAAHKASRPISDEEEYYVGRAVGARLLTSYPLLKKQRMTEYVNTVGATLAMHSEKPFTHGGYHFAILNADEANAFACPGGTIFITEGMLRTAKNEDELAAVLAHEIAHVNHRDGIGAISKSRWTEALTIIGTKAAKSYGSAELANLVSIFEGSIDDVVKTLVVNGYGRSQEYDADKSALAILEKAGYNPAALKDFLDRLSAGGKGSEGGILKTHPSTSDRIGNVMESMPAGKVDLALMKKRTARFSEALR